MRFWTAVICLALGFALTAVAAEHWPRGPHPGLTPGSICRNPDEIRYPERIPYCSRSVKAELKEEIVRRYDRTLGTQIGRIGRRQFKIDHLIPLCLGGSNEPDNLWPQHPTLFALTDPIEERLCIRLREGKMKQAEAITLILRAKRQIEEAPVILDRLQEL
jgi:hypothetical protein